MDEIYSKASAIWAGMEAFRTERARCKRYVYGEQWGEIINTELGRMTEGEYMRRTGERPMTNNILRRILRNVVGLYRAQYRVPPIKDTRGLKGSELREAAGRRKRWFAQNRMEELAPRLLEEFLISGIAAVKMDGGRILPVTPDNFFFHSDGYDPRGCDVDLIGEMHRVSYGTLLERFCTTADDYRRISSAYGAESHSVGGCLLMEVWAKESSILAISHDEQEATLSMLPVKELRSHSSLKNEDLSLIVKTGWRRRWYAQDGTLLRKSELLDAHPYEFKAYPYLDGEIHSYMSDLLDQQRFVNRLITLYDLIMRSSAKGVLLFPDESIPTGMDLQDVADEWSQFNGVIPYRARPGVPMPTQVSSNSTNIGITELLKIEMQMLEDISGVSPTLQGKLVGNATSGTLFSQQNEAAQTSLLDIIRSFSDFLSRLADRV